MWRIDLNELQNIELINQGKKFKDLVAYAKAWFNMDADRVREILKSKGHTSFESKLYWHYIGILVEEWDHVKKLRHEQNAKEIWYQELLALEATLTKVVDDDCWRWMGTEEALDAHWKLEDLRREERLKKWRQRFGQRTLYSIC